jgi:hypothetical protein
MRRGHRQFLEVAARDEGAVAVPPQHQYMASWLNVFR